MASEIVVYDDFSRGEAGRLGLSKPPEPGYFSGKNVLVYSNGMLGPRPGWKDMAVTGVPTGVVVAQGSLAIRHIVIAQSGTSLKAYHFPVTSGARAVTAAAPVTVPAATIQPLPATQPPDGWLYAGYTNDLYATIGDELLVSQLDIAGGQTDTFRGIGYSGRRLYLSHNRVIRYSDPDPTNRSVWPSVNTFHVDNVTPAIHQFRTGTVFVTRHIGVSLLLGTTKSGRLVKLTPGTAPAFHGHSTVDHDDVLWYLQEGQDVLTYFDGATRRLLGHIPVLDGTKADDPNNLSAPRLFGMASGETAKGPDAKLAIASGRLAGAPSLMTYFDGRTWTQHTAPASVALSGAVQPWPTRPGVYWAATVSTETTAPRFLSWAPLLDRPAFTTDADSLPGDDSTTPLNAFASLPEHWRPQGEEARVRQVVIDLVKWNTGSATPNQLDVTVETFGRRDVAGESPATRSWTEAGNSSSRSGTRQRLVLDFGITTPGAGFQVKLANIKGVAIRSVIAVLDVYPGRPGR